MSPSLGCPTPLPPPGTENCYWEEMHGRKRPRSRARGKIQLRPHRGRVGKAPPRGCSRLGARFVSHRRGSPQTRGHVCGKGWGWAALERSARLPPFAQGMTWSSALRLAGTHHPKGACNPSGFCRDNATSARLGTQHQTLPVTTRWGGPGASGSQRGHHTPSAWRQTTPSNPPGGGREAAALIITTRPPCPGLALFIVRRKHHGSKPTEESCLPGLCLENNGPLHGGEDDRRARLGGEEGDQSNATLKCSQQAFSRHIHAKPRSNSVWTQWVVIQGWRWVRGRIVAQCKLCNGFLSVL
ncbi:LOW QUALITY PROTEIN: uncharacterized protein LOC112549939 [Alligator sinensis]|uniref:LOW QUALITY PROTEIN: uncharacterized protein LOC112549939 n=1 Tax=Alligator sinensis TaxID=38654 RepID=A0A3Q0GCZ6_ALLSI|nr:LOW QUALITY PROTEIN: uncharacterized protein LOC112549939 [Alligator sinensis]